MLKKKGRCDPGARSANQAKGKEEERGDGWLGSRSNGSGQTLPLLLVQWQWTWTWTHLGTQV